MLVHVKSKGKRNDKLHMDEVKYCKDADTKQQENRATAQHIELTGHARKAGYAVKTQVILLGVRGTVYHSAPETLDTLRVRSSCGQILMMRLSNYAVNQMRMIMFTDKEGQGEGGPWGTRQAAVKKLQMRPLEAAAMDVRCRTKY